MPLLPNLPGAYTSRDVTDTFQGYNHKLKIGHGEFYDTMNLSSRDYPMLGTRLKRGTVKTLQKPQGIFSKEALGYVDNGTLYYNGEATPVNWLTEGEKQIISMGAYICIWPDKAYYNTADPADFGSMDQVFRSSGTVTYQMCNLTGVEYEFVSSETEPEEPEDHMYWYDTSRKGLYQYSAATGKWTGIVTVYTKLTFESYGIMPRLFRKFDGVTVGSTPYEELNGSKLIYDIGGDEINQDYIILTGLIGEPKSSSAQISIDRLVPDMDYVIECQNRLWGCYYGPSENGNLNEIYCSVLGDFRNWRVYQGLSNDSWTSSVGSDGPWTGAVNFMGYPTFFKEERIHRVSVSATGAHSVSETVCRGVQRGSAGSLAIVNETLFYKSRSDVCAYQGGFPYTISAPLGDVVYTEAAAGSFGDSYIINMKDHEGWNLFVFNTTNGLWIKEDNLHVMGFARVEDELYAIDKESGKLLALRGTTGTLEDKVEWMAQSGILYYENPDKKYVSRYDIRLSAELGAEVHVEIQYDSDGIWHDCGTHHFKGLNTILYPIRPRRCDHMELRISGTGPVKIYSIARILEGGSDV